MQNSAPGDTSGDKGRSTIDRTLTVLECFNVRNTELSVSEISRRSGLPVATAYRIVAKLLSWGALERATGRKYSIGLRLWEVASLAPRHATLRNAALPCMLRLQRNTGYSVFLAARERREGIWIEGVWGERGPDPGRWSVGSRFPLHASAPGWVLLAFADTALQEEIYAGGLPAVSEHTVTDPVVLRCLVNGVKWRGHAVADRETCDGVSAVAAPIHAAGGTVASLVVCSAATDGPPDQHARPVLAAARSISQRLARPRPREGGVTDRYSLSRSA